MILAAPAAQSHLDQTVEREPCATSVHPAVLIKHYGRPERMHAKEDLQPCASGRPAWWRNIARPRQSPAISKLPHNSPELHRIHIAAVDKQLIHRYRVIRYLKPGSRRLLHALTVCMYAIYIICCQFWFTINVFIRQKRHFPSQINLPLTFIGD